MPPFLAGKATREDRKIMKLEREGSERIAAALAKLRRDLFRGVTEDNVHEITRRLNDRDIMQPFQDSIIGLLNEWALAGADNGREDIERDIFGTIQ